MVLFLDCGIAAEQLKNNPRHKAYLEGVSLRQLKKLHSLLRGHLRGESLAESLEKIQQEETIDPEEDMNKLDDKELAKRKSIMDELFEKNRKKKDDPDFIYDIEVEFPQDEQLESCGWDVESCEEVWFQIKTTMGRDRSHIPKREQCHPASSTAASSVCAVDALYIGHRESEA